MGMGDGEGTPTPIEVAGGVALLLAVVALVVAFVWLAGPRATGPSLHKCEGEGSNFSCRAACGFSGWRFNESAGECEPRSANVEAWWRWIVIDELGEVVAAIMGLVVGALRPWRWLWTDPPFG